MMILRRVIASVLIVLLGTGFSSPQSMMIFEGLLPTPNITPANLTFSVVTAPTRNIGLFNSQFVIDPLDNFQSGTPSTTYSETDAGGASASYSVSGCTISGSGTSAQTSLVSKQAQSIGPYVFAEATVSAQTNSIVSVGVVNAAQTHFVIVNPQTDNHIRINTNMTGTGASSSSLVYTLSFPYTIRIVFEYPEVQLWMTDSNGTNRLLTWITGSPTADLRLQTRYQGEGWKPYFGAQGLAAGAMSAVFTSFRSGYTGAIGMTNPKPVTYLDGQPYISNNKAYFWVTCNNGNSFQAGHGAIISVDLNTYAISLLSLLFFNVSSSAPTSPSGPFDTTTSLSVGQVLWTGSQWQFYMSDWGYDTVTSTAGIQIYTATTNANILTGNNVVVSNAYMLSLPSSATASYYDNTQYQDHAGTWHLVAAQTNALSSWSSFAPSLLSGPSIGSLSLVSGPSSTLGEGPNWTQIGGKKFISTSGNALSTSPHWFDSGLNLLGGGTFPGTIDLATYPPLSTGYYSHFAFVPIPYGKYTKYMLAYMDNSTITPVVSGSALNGGKGAIVIETSQSVFGHEHF